jgi:ATP-dependent DNA helicase RecG
MEFRVAQLPAHAHLLDQVQAVASEIIDKHAQLVEPLIKRWTGSGAEFAKV